MTFKTGCYIYGLTSFVSLVTMCDHSQTACSVCYHYLCNSVWWSRNDRLKIWYCTFFFWSTTSSYSRRAFLASQFDGSFSLLSSSTTSWWFSLRASFYQQNAITFHSHVNRADLTELCVNGLHCQNRVCFKSTPTTLKLLSRDVYQGFNTWLTTSVMSSS